MAATKIEWADAVWNPVTGCTPISEACDHCYAKRMATRLAGRYGYPADDPFRPGWWHQEAYDNFKPPKGKRVFVCSMSDLFHEAVPVRALDLVLQKVNANRDTIFMLLTKRPERMKYFLGERAPQWKSGLGWEYDLPLPNLWLGVTAENQPRANERITILLQIPAAVRFVSVEPMLSHINLQSSFNANALHDIDGGPRLDWVICGGETGPGARPMHPDWLRSLRDQCVAAGVPFFFKGWGDLDPVFHQRIGKKASGRLLDGREWNEFPKEGAHGD